VGRASRAAIAVSACAGLLAGCGAHAQRAEIVRALALKSDDGGRTYRTPQGCMIEAIVVGRERVAYYRLDQASSLFENRSRTAGVKAVGLSPACQASVRRGLGTIR
jgi:hypothetical protein